MPSPLRSIVLLSLALGAGCSSGGASPATDAAPAGAERDAAAARDTAAETNTDASVESSANADGAPGADLGPDLGPIDSCAGVVCNTLPPAVCQGDVLKTFYDPNGTCEQGVCAYRYSMQQCPNGCQGGRCLEVTCDGGGGCGPGPGPGPSCPGPGCDAGCDGASCGGPFVTCTTGSVSFSADVTDLSSLVAVGTLPALAGGAAYEIRSYMQVKESYSGIRVPVYAPTNMTLVASSHYTDPLHSGSDPDYHGEWGLTFEASCTTQVSFAHIREVVAEIAAVTVPSSSGGSAGELVSRRVDFKAGDVIGYYIRGPGYLAWDFIVTDTAVTNVFVNAARYQDGQLKFLHAICPFAPYPTELRQKYLAILGSGNDPPRAGRMCGTVAHDVAGTAAGAWFHFPYTGGGADEARRSSGNPFSLFKGETDPVYVANLDGDTNNGGRVTFRIDPTNPTYRNPDTITTSHCYERHDAPTGPGNGWAYVKVVAPAQLAVAYSLEGTCPSAFPTTGVRTYYR